MRQKNLLRLALFAGDTRVRHKPGKTIGGMRRRFNQARKHLYLNQVQRPSKYRQFPWMRVPLRAVALHIGVCYYEPG